MPRAAVNMDTLGLHPEGCPLQGRSKAFARHPRHSQGRSKAFARDRKAMKKRMTHQAFAELRCKLANKLGLDKWDMQLTLPNATMCHRSTGRAAVSQPMQASRLIAS